MGVLFKSFLLASLLCLSLGENITSKPVKKIHKPVDSYLPTWYWWREKGNEATQYDNYDNVDLGYLAFMFLGNGRDSTEFQDTIPNSEPYTLTYHDAMASPPMVDNMKNQNMKLLLAIGGWTHEARAFPSLITNDYNTKVFIDSSRQVIRDSGAIGLDFDWEYPGDELRGGTITDNIYFPQFLHRVRSELSRSIPDYIQHVTVGINPKIGYDIEGLFDSNDRVNLMSYDMYGNWDQRLYYNSPWVNEMETIGFSVKEAIDLWTFNNTKYQDKIAVGYASYGRGQDCIPGKCVAQERGIATSFVSPLSQEAGVMDYQELIYMLDNKLAHLVDARYNSVVDQVEVVLSIPHHTNNYWLTIDDASTICRKAQKVRSVYGITQGFMWHFYADKITGVLQNGLSMGLDKNVTKCPDMVVDDNGVYSIYPDTPSFLKKYLNDADCTIDYLPMLDECFHGTNCPEAYYYDANIKCVESSVDTVGDCSQATPNCEFVATDASNQYIWCVNDQEFLMTCPDPLLFDTTICGCNYAETKHRTKHDYDYDDEE